MANQAANTHGTMAELSSYLDQIRSSELTDLLYTAGGPLSDNLSGPSHGPTGANGDYGRSQMLGVWSETLWKQFQETPGLEYLGESCKALSEAIRHTPHGNLFLVDRLGKLAIRLHLYYLRT
jgi:hypothetical protein